VAYAQGRTKEFPNSKPKKTTPVKTTNMLMIHCDDQVHLIKRPNHGIWGGLHCFPEFDSKASMIDWLDQQNLGGVLQQLPQIRHTFSHYHLDITPYHLRLVQPSAGVVMEADNALWYCLSSPPQVGLAAITQTLLENIK